MSAQNEELENGPATREALLLYYWYILRKRQLVVYGFAGLLTLTVLVATLLSTPYYGAEAVLEIAPRAPDYLESMQGPEELVQASGSSELRAYYATQYRIIQSRTVAEKTLAALRAAGVTEFDAQQKPVEFLQAHMTLQPVPETHVVKIVFEYPDAALAALFANTMAEVYMQHNVDRLQESSAQALGWLRQRQEDMKQQKQASDARVTDFRIENELVGLNKERSASAEALDRLLGSWGEVHTSKVRVEAAWRELVRLRDGQGWLALANHLGSTHPVLEAMLSRHQVLLQEKASLEARYLPDHPRLLRVRTELEGLEAQIRGQVDVLVAARGAELAVIQGEEDALAQERDRLREEVAAMDRRLDELSVLEAEQDRNQVFFKALDTRSMEVALSNLATTGNVRFVDRAQAGTEPVRPVVSVNVLMGIVMGLFGGCALAFLMEYLDSTVKSREDVEQVIGAPFLGVVPRVDPEESRRLADERDRNLFVHAMPRSTVAECLRTVRTNLLFSTRKRSLRRLLITSAVPEEGKSFISGNLAAVIAMTGSRVLLIDSDLRRPTLHRLFKVPNDRGFADVLAGRCQADEVIVPTHVPGLDLLVAGPTPANPSELLGSERTRRVLDQLGRYDMILIDSPPITVVADPLVMSSLADGVVLVVESDHTRKGLVAQAARRLAEMDAELLGAIVNKVDVRRAGYGYSYYYEEYRYYGPSDAEDRRSS